jgi:hypothetical protein
MRSARNSMKHGILTANLCAGDTPEQREAFSEMLDQLQAELEPSSVLEVLIVERIAAALWRTRRVLDFEAGSALERDAAPSPLERLVREIETEAPSDPEALERARALSRSLAAEGVVNVVIRYEAHLTRELSRLLVQLEHARRLCSIEGLGS